MGESRRFRILSQLYRAWYTARKYCKLEKCDVQVSLAVMRSLLQPDEFARKEPTFILFHQSKNGRRCQSFWSGTWQYQRAAAGFLD